MPSLDLVFKKQAQAEMEEEPGQSYRLSQMFNEKHMKDKSGYGWLIFMTKYPNYYGMLSHKPEKNLTLQTEDTARTMASSNLERRFTKSSATFEL